MNVARFENDGRAAAVLFILATAALSLPFLLFEHLPFVDLPVHIARQYIVSAPPGADVLEFYGAEISITPNSAVDLLLYLIGYSGDPFVATRVVHLIYVANLMLAALVFHRVVLGKWSVWPLLCAVFVYNGPLQWGFENYIFTLPFAIHGASLWLISERWGVARRLAIFTVVAAVLYMGHAIAFAMLAAFAAGRVAQQVFQDRTLDFGHGLILAIPFTLPLLHLYAAFGQGENTFASKTYYGGLWSRVRSLGQVVQGGPGTIEGPGPEIALAMLLMILSAPAALFLLRQERPVLARRILGALILLLAVALLAPNRLVGIDVAARLSVFIALLVVAALDWTVVAPRVRAAALLVGLVFAATRVAVSMVEFRDHQRDIAELRGMIAQIPRGSRILPLNDADALAPANQWQVAAISVIDRGNFVPELFQGTHWLTVREPYVNSAVPINSTTPWQVLLDLDNIPDRARYVNQNGVIYLEDWPRKFTHAFFITKPKADVAALLPLDLVAEGQRYALYAVRPAQ